MLELRNVNSFYGESQVLHDVSMVVDEGSCTVLLGRNGAGKTATLKSIAGHLVPRTGEILLEGKPITRDAVYVRAQKGLTYVASEGAIFARLTVGQNLSLAQGRHKGETWNKERVFAFLPTLRRVESRLAGVLSGGERQMLKLGMALLTEPRLILLDEPTQGVAPVVVTEMRKSLADLLDTGMSILLSEQNVSFASKLGQQAHVIEKGVIVASGSIKEMFESKAIDKYLAV